MEANERRISAALLPLLDIPKDGRLLTFGAGSANVGLELAAARPDVLVVICDTTCVITRPVSDRAVSERLDNVIVGDTPAGPLVDRALCFDSFEAMQDMELITLRNAVLPGGFAIFADEKANANDIVDKLKKFGYGVADALSPAENLQIVRGR